MPKASVFVVGLLLLAACEQGQAPSSPASQVKADRPDRAETEAYIRRSAEQWAAGDAKAMQVFMADDYEGVGSTGEIRDKKMQLKLAVEPSPYSGSRVDYVNFRHFGDTVIAQGAETLTRKDGGPDRRLIWTDTWLYRNGQWQVVASQDSVRPPAQ